MAQLTSIITSQLAWGSVGLVFSGLFGIAVRMEWNAQLAPRTSNRPKSVLKNVLDHKTPFVNIYPLAFLLWAWKLSYPNGLMGISGTGSRNNGWAGPTLKWNLDGVILLKYHKMLLKISVLATVLCLFVLLPAYITATCDPTMLGLQTCARLSNLTDFENLTIAHIPDKVWQDSLSRPATNNSNNNPMEGVLWVPGVSLRTLLVVVCCCILYTYTLYLLWYEWMDNLALRRVFFLEADHYPRRIKELDEITAIQGIIPVDPVTSERPPYIPDPELRDTPPAVSLYSVLYQLPESLLTYDTDGATQLERQIVATTNFFDQCVPPQAGYTSSVAAVTIVPDAAKVAKAWMKWYKVETKLRRLRYLRSLLQKKLQKEMDGSTDVYDAIAGVVHHSKHGIETTATTVAAAVSQAARTATQTAKNATHNIAQSLNKVRTPNKGKLATMPEENELDRDDVMNEMIGEEHAPLVMTGQGPEKDTLDTTQPATDVVQEDGGEEVTVEFVSGKALEVETSPRRSGADSASDKSDTGSATQQQDESGGNPFVSLWSRWVGNGDDVTSQHTAANGVDIEMQPIMDKKASTEEIDEDSSSTFSAKPSPSSRRIRSEILASDEVEVTPEIEQAMDFFYDDFDVKRYAKKLGFDEETELVDIVDGLGIEELSVFAREYAQSSANPCVYGMSPHLLNFKSIEELQEMEHELWEDLRDCNAELIAARKQAVEHADDEEGFVTSGAEAKNSDDEFEYEANGDEIGRISIPSPTLKAFCGEQTGGLRNRHAFSASDDQWEMAKEQAAGMRYVPESEWNGDGQKRPWLRRHMPCCREPLKALPKYYGIMEGTGKAFVTALDHPTYAVVTFTSRQAAIAARQSLADGGATNTWKQVDDIPIPPLADAPPRNLLFFRGCCRPVTLTINYKEKKLRRWSVIVVLFFFCCLYTIPLTFIQHLLDPETLTKWFPDAEGLKDPTSQTYRALSRLAGPFSGLMYTLFFSFLPQVFKWLAFFDGTSSSMEKAERYALLLYWYFMLVTAFTGTALANMFFAWINADLSTEETIRQALNTVAGNIPSTLAPTFLNWIIMRYSFTWPGGYLFQMNAFITRALNMKWCNRIMRGGGPGPPTPYRIFVDSGVVFMCITALSPACPLIAPAAMLYYLIVQPILRWLLIFVYRPKYDGGGDKWPQLHQIIISALMLGQVLMAVTLSLKAAYWEGIFVGCCAIPTYFFHLFTLERFYRPYHDAALLQTSRLDSWQESHSLKKREEYRRWLVDCHKASYVPICMLGSKENLLTAEPAVAVPRESDEDYVDTTDERRGFMRKQSAQRGAIFNRKFK